MADIVKITPLGGLDESGRDCYVVEINQDIFVLDCGFALPDKSIPGVDFLLPNFDYLIENKDRIKAYILTHGHDENMGALKYFYKKAPAPVYCTSATQICLEATTFLHDSKIVFDYHIIQPSQTEYIAGHKVVFFQTCHNAAFSFGVGIETDKGYIVYTSDFIVDYSVKEKGFVFDLPKLYEITENNTLVLMSESKAANKPGYCAPKHRVTHLIENYFKENKRIFIDCFWQNVFRIQEILTLCQKYQKSVFYYNDYTRDVMKSYFQFAQINFDKNLIISRENLLRVPSGDVVVLMLGNGDELYHELSQLAKHTNKDRRFILGEGDIFINAAIALPSQEIIATRSIDSLYRTGCEVVWLKSKVLTSMHACQDDLSFFLSILKPKYYLPVRGSFVNLMDNAKLALSMSIGLNHSNVFIIDNGMQFFIDENSKARIIPNEVNKINIVPVLVDGKGISKVGTEIISDRIKLGQDGVVVIASTISASKKCIIAGPDCQMRGFVYVKEAEPILRSLSNIYVSEIETFFMANNSSLDATKEQICERARRFIKRENGREPLILPIINVID